MSLDASQKKCRVVANAYSALMGALETWAPFKTLIERVGVRQADLFANKFSIMVLGEFKRGKSTLINAMLGSNALPNKLTPCTAVITFVRHGDKPEFVVHFKDDTPAEVLTPKEFNAKYTLQIDDLRNIDQSDEMAVAKIIQDRFSRIDHAELRFPSPLCDNGVEIVDTPGLEEDEARTLRVIESLGRADAVILIVDVVQTFNQREVFFFDTYLRPLKLDKRLFIAVNYWNLIRARVLEMNDEQAVEEAAGNQWEMIKHKLFPLVARGGQNPVERVFKIDARGALQNRIGIAGAPPLENTGVPDLEKSLTAFLASERDAARDSTDAALVSDIRSTVHEQLASHLETAALPLEEARAELAKTEIRLKHIEARSQGIKDYIQSSGAEIADKVTANLGSYIDREIEANAEGIAESVNIDEVASLWRIYGASIDFLRSHENKFSTKLEVHIRHEIQRIIGALMEKWNDENLATVLNAETPALMSRLDALIGEYLQEREDIQSGREGLPNLSHAEISARVRRLMQNTRIGKDMEHGKQFIDLTPIIAGIVAEIVAEVILHKVLIWSTLGVGAIVSAILAILRGKRVRTNIRSEIAKGLYDNAKTLKVTMKDAVREKITQAMKEMASSLSVAMSQDITLIRASKQNAVSQLEEKDFDFEKLINRIEQLESEVGRALAGVDAVLAKAARDFA